MLDKKELLEFLYDQAFSEYEINKIKGAEYVRAYGKVAQHFCDISPTDFYCEIEKRSKKQQRNYPTK